MMNNMISLKSISNKVLDALEAHFKDSGYNRYAINREAQYGIAEIITHSGTYHAKYYFSPLRDEFCLDITLPVIIPMAYMASVQIYLSEKMSNWYSGCAHLRGETGTVNLHKTFNLTAVKRRINDFRIVLDAQSLAEEEKNAIMNACINAVLPSKEVIEYMELELLSRMVDFESNLYRIAAGLSLLQEDKKGGFVESAGGNSRSLMHPSVSVAAVKAAIKSIQQRRNSSHYDPDEGLPDSADEEEDAMKYESSVSFNAIEQILSLMSTEQDSQGNVTETESDETAVYDDSFEAGE